MAASKTTPPGCPGGEDIELSLIDQSEPYPSGYGVIVITPAEHALRKELLPLALADKDVLSGPQRERVADYLRAAKRSAARHLRGEYE